MSDVDKEIGHWKAKYAMLLDSAEGLRWTVKELYNASCFDVETMPPEITRAFPKLVREATNKALMETTSVASLVYARNLRESKESGNG